MRADNFLFKKMSTQRANVERELFSACEAGDVDRVHRVIAAGADPRKAIKRDILAGHGETPLHTACQYVHCLIKFRMKFYPYYD